jgi:dehydrogenase/reductase SDR family protein 12
VRVQGAPPLSPSAEVVDLLLEASVAGSFSKIGPAVRRRTAHWEKPPSAEGRMIVITGATSGLGRAAATALVALGASVCLVGRDAQRAESARWELAGTGPGEVTTELADLGDLEAVAALADRLAQRFAYIDVLVHNAGALTRSYRRAPNGHEWTVTVQVLAPYLLTERLWDRLVASSARVITMTSGGMYTQRFALDDLEMEEDRYDGVVAYARAKRAQVVLTGEWQRRAQGALTFHAVHPGWADTPGLISGLPRFAKRLGPLLRTPALGADTAVFLAASPPGEPAGGHLWLDRRPRSEYRLPWTWSSPASRMEEGRTLWAWCERRVPAAPE